MPKIALIFCLFIFCTWEIAEHLFADENIHQENIPDDTWNWMPTRRLKC
jgi:hypothetical protein